VAVLVHFRLTVPDDLSDRVRDLLVDGECITNVTVESGICVDPEGDLIECDVAREQAGMVLHQLNELGLDERGGIVLTTPLSTPFAEASRLEALAPGHPDDAVIWESVEAKADDGAQPTVSYLVFLVLAVILAAIAVITDSAILVVGAMVVGPEFSAVAAVSVGIVFARWGLAGRSLQLLVFSFAFAVAVVAVLAWLVSLTGALDAEMITRPRPNTGFIWQPDMWSFVVALVAGAAGVLALAIEKTATMVGVFISVTTVPAAGNLALGLGLWQASEIFGSLEQLGLNIAGMVVSGVLVLAVMRTSWTWVTTRSERLFGQRRPRRGPQPQPQEGAR
jgi:uncharacterized hydrophobic protein (TIGR00271 family)